MFSPPMAGPPAASLPGPAPYFQPVPRAVSIVDDFRLELIARYIAVGETKKALAVADKVKDRRRLVECLLGLATPTFQPPSYPAPPPASPFQRELLDYVDRELDRMEQRGYSSGATRPHPAVVEAPPAAKEEPLMPVPAGKKTPMDDCGKEWAMAPTNLYGLFPNGWEHEADHVPGYVINETGRQLRDRLAKAFTENDLAAMKEFCESFIRLDDIPLSSPWFDTSGGRLQGRIKYTLNEKAKPVVELLRDIAGVKADSKKEFVELARKSLKRIDAIIHAKTEE
jgi:hypothetical protein